MSTPMETNTEELREILQQVYDLPNAGSGGGSEPDLVIVPTEYFHFFNRNDNATYNVHQISFDPNSVVSAYEKLSAGNDIRVVLTGLITLNSWNPPFMMTCSATRSLVYGPDIEPQGNWLVVRFNIPCTYWFLSQDAGELTVEYRFLIISTGEVVLQSAVMYD